MRLRERRRGGICFCSNKGPLGVKLTELVYFDEFVDVLLALQLLRGGLVNIVQYFRFGHFVHSKGYKPHGFQPARPNKIDGGCVVPLFEDNGVARVLFDLAFRGELHDFVPWDQRIEVQVLQKLSQLAQVLVLYFLFGDLSRKAHTHTHTI